MLRTVLAVIAGVVVGAVVVGAVEMIGHRIWPPPEGLDPSDREALAAHVETLPAAALVSVLVAWAVGSLAGGWVAARIALRGRLVAALVVGGLLLVAGVVNLVSFPHPTWFSVVGVLVFLPAAWLGARLAGVARPAAAGP